MIAVREGGRPSVIPGPDKNRRFHRRSRGLPGRSGWLAVSVLITPLEKWVSELGAVRHRDAMNTPSVGGDRDAYRLPDSSEDLAVWADAMQDPSAMKADIQARYGTPATG